MEYASFYPLLHIMDNTGHTDGVTGGRIFAQTLNEAQWAIWYGAVVVNKRRILQYRILVLTICFFCVHRLALSYDLLFGIMTPTERALVEYNLLKHMSVTVQRNDARMWHLF